jgi:hypothetical protein
MVGKNKKPKRELLVQGSRRHNKLKFEVISFN